MTVRVQPLILDQLMHGRHASAELTIYLQAKDTSIPF